MPVALFYVIYTFLSLKFSSELAGGVPIILGNPRSPLVHAFIGSIFNTAVIR